MTLLEFYNLCLEHILLVLIPESSVLNFLRGRMIVVAGKGNKKNGYHKNNNLNAPKLKKYSNKILLKTQNCKQNKCKI